MFLEVLENTKCIYNGFCNELPGIHPMLALDNVDVKANV